MSVALVSTVINAPSDEVWARIADFTGWHTWLPRIVAIRMSPGGEGGPVGSVRHLTLSDGSEVDEQLLARDDLARHLAYTFVGDSPFRVHRYVGAVTVHPVTTTGASFVQWSGDFDADADSDEARTAATFERLYGAFLAALTEASEQPATVPA
ncbi:MAG TPA: SRPBCC family protein [Jatrophihabitantaceae bacterium]|jgi:hypothetical protein